MSPEKARTKAIKLVLQNYPKPTEMQFISSLIDSYAQYILTGTWTTYK